MIRLMIADKHPLVRYGLKRAFEPAGIFTIVAEAATFPELWRLLSWPHVDVLICETAILGGTSCDKLGEILKRRPRLAIVVFSMYVDASYVVATLRRGAKAYVSKEASLEELACAVRHAASGKQYIDSRLRVQASDAILETGPGGHDALSPRETEVLRLIVEGMRTGEIAQALDVSAKTISTHRARILEKMKLATSQQIIRHVIQQRFMDHGKIITEVPIS